MMDDLISRQDVLEICDWYEREFCECDFVVKLISEDIKKLPSEPERKTGKWEHPNRCSECGFGVLLNPYMHNLDTGEYTLLYKFCPNCGCAMEG